MGLRNADHQSRVAAGQLVSLGLRRRPAFWNHGGGIRSRVDDADDRFSPFARRLVDTAWIGDGARAVRRALVPIRRRARSAFRWHEPERAYDNAIPRVCSERLATGRGRVGTSSSAKRVRRRRRCELRVGPRRDGARAPSAAFAKPEPSIRCRTSSLLITPFSTSNSASARTRAAEAGSPTFVMWSWSCVLTPRPPASVRRRPRRPRPRLGPGTRARHRVVGS